MHRWLPRTVGYGDLLSNDLVERDSLTAFGRFMIGSLIQFFNWKALGLLRSCKHLRTA